MMTTSSACFEVLAIMLEGSTYLWQRFQDIRYELAVPTNNSSDYDGGHLQLLINLCLQSQTL